MHFVVFLCGVLGGVVPLGSGWWGQPDLLLVTDGLPGWVAGLLVVAIHVIALSAIVGGTLVFLSAAASRIVLLSSSVAWLVLVAALGHGITPVVAILIILIAAGGFASFLPSVQQPLLSLRDPSALPLWQLPERTPEGAPGLGRPRTPSRKRADRRRAEPTFGEAPASAIYSSNFVLGPVTRPRSSRTKARRERQRQILGVVGLVGLMAVLFVIVLVNSQLFSAQKMAARAGASPLDGAASTPSQPSVSVADLSSSSATSSAAPSDETALVADPSSASFAEERLPSQALGLPQQYTSLPPITAVASSPTSSSGSAPAPASSAASTAAEFASLPPVSSASSAEASVAKATASQPLPSHFATPADYCSAVGNTDTPEASKITGGVAGMTAEARTQAAMPQGEVRWRCMDNAVWVCVQPPGSLSCDKVPSSVDRVLICAAHPDTQGIRTAGGDWSCNGFTPVVSKGQLDAPDHRGFDRSVWHTLKGDADPPAHTSG